MCGFANVRMLKAVSLKLAGNSYCLSEGAGEWGVLDRKEP